MADFRAGTGKVQDETKRAWCARKQGMWEWWEMSKVQLAA